MATKRAGEIIREIRLSKGITATHMAKKLDYKAVSSYLRLEKGDSVISLDKAKIIADILGVDVNNFFDENLHESRKEKPA